LVGGGFIRDVYVPFIHEKERKEIRRKIKCEKRNLNMREYKGKKKE